MDFRPQSLRQVRRARLQPEGSGVGAAGSRRAKHVAVAEEANFEELPGEVGQCGWMRVLQIEFQNGNTLITQAVLKTLLYHTTQTPN